MIDTRICTVCNTKFPRGDMYCATLCRWCYTYRKSNIKRLWLSSKCSARTKGLEHTIKVTDIVIPDKCPYFGVPFKIEIENSLRSRNDWAPSIDRINSKKGYIPGNIQVISELANKMKSNANCRRTHHIRYCNFHESRYRKKLNTVCLHHPTKHNICATP
jgi:hypothetical protein